VDDRTPLARFSPSEPLPEPKFLVLLLFAAKKSGRKLVICILKPNTQEHRLAAFPELEPELVSPPPSSGMRSRRTQHKSCPFSDIVFSAPST
jgi:hypothetical protein